MERCKAATPESTLPTFRPRGAGTLLTLPQEFCRRRQTLSCSGGSDLRLCLPRHETATHGRPSGAAQPAHGNFAPTGKGKQIR